MKRTKLRMYMLKLHKMKMMTKLHMEMHLEPFHYHSNQRDG